ncbi:ADP-ribosylglycohydrolase family protein [Candidatus Woesearchaeota archaeon]|nr:ADP-ribosylglycohydrolase family protein [Candidatus Woesearchaeota archaeon]
MVERYKATLLGCGIGDALGQQVEGWSAEEIARYAGRITGLIGQPYLPADATVRRHNRKRGECTDDTILTLAVAESIVSCGGLNLEDMCARQLRAYSARKRPDGSVAGGFGRTTREAFEHMLRGIPPEDAGVDGLGNGPAMKMAPVGLYMASSGRYEEGIRFAAALGYTTHLDPRSIASGVVQAHAVCALLSYATRDAFLDSLVDASARCESALSPPRQLSNAGSLTERLAWVRDHRDADADTAHRVLGSSGLAFESHPFALFMLQRHWQEPLSGMLATINAGGDTDTTGALYGALCGALHGMVFPAEWVTPLDWESLVAAGQGIYALRKP